MPSFQYQSLTQGGDRRTGVLTAGSRAEAVRVLLSRGETATRIQAMDGTAVATPKGAQAAVAGGPSLSSAAHAGRTSAATGAGAAAARLFARRADHPSLGRGELATLIREIATAIEAGLPLMQSLTTVRRQAHGKAMPVILDYLIDRVEAGDPLYVAARDYGKPFDDMIVGMLRAADASGEMSDVLHQLADLLERSVELRREVLGATFYPLIVAGLIIASTIVLVTVVVPRLLGPMTANAAFELPWPTRIVLGTADFIQSYWLPVAIAAGVGWLGWIMWIAAPANRYRVDRFLLQVPVLGRLLRDVAVARFTRTLGTLTTAGLPILDALRITSSTLGNRALLAALSEVQDQVTAGKSLAEPLERSGLFPPLLVQVVGLGERSGRLDRMLMHAAVAFDRQVNMSIKLFTKALPPLLLVIMASLGGFELSAILLPLLELQSLVQ